MINNNYVPEWYSTPFEHMRYTLARNQDQLDILFDTVKAPFEFLEGDADARVNFTEDHAIVQIKDCDWWNLNQIHGLLLHEAVHIWQAHTRAIGSLNDHGDEEEAYAIQAIAQELMYSFREQVYGK